MNRLSLSRARELLGKARDTRILVVGDLMLDRYLKGSVERISPEAPVPVVRVEEESWALGGAGNVAANVMALGAGCQVVGVVGADPEGRLLKEALEELGVEVEGVVETNDRPTTVKTRIMARHQHVTRVDREGAADVSPHLARLLARKVETLAPEVGGMALEDYNKGVLVSSLIRTSLGAALEKDIPVVVDPKRLRFFEFREASVFKPNARELESALGEAIRPRDPEWMDEVRLRLGCRTLLLTLGEEGMALSSRDEGHLTIPTVARDVYDVSGAGDTVTAVVTVALAAGASVEDAAILANHAAAVEVGKAGVATVTPDEILEQHEAFIREEPS